MVWQTMADTPARARANKELGAKFAHLLDTMPHSHQLGVCAELRIPWRTHMRWMAADSDEDSDLAEYQGEVIAALARQRARDLDDIEVAVEAAEGSKTATVWNMRKHRHESRFKRFYDEVPTTKHEHSGPDGKPIQVDAYARMSDAQLLAIATGAVAAPVAALGDGEGEPDE